MSRRKFDETFKKKIIQEYEAGGISYYCLGKKYGIDAKCVRSWCRLYKQYGDNYFRYLEKVNLDEVLVRVIDKLELSTPKRKGLSVYRYILEKEFEQNNCFYCGKKLTSSVHVDHFIPWSFVHDDKMWNFVLSCSTCNVKKNNKIPSVRYLTEIKR